MHARAALPGQHRFFHANTGRRLKILGFFLILLMGGALLLLAAKWPFTREAAIQSLEQVSLCDVRIARFEKTFFPNPGYIADDVTFSRDPSFRAKPIATIGRVSCRATWPAMITFTHRISRMDLQRVLVIIPRHVPPGRHKHPAEAIKTTVTDLYANGMVLEIAPRHEGAQTVRFDFPELVLSDLARNKPIHFRTLARTPLPPGDLRVTGTFGPPALQNIAASALSGSFQLRQADLGFYKFIGGTLAADGQFKGTLGHTDVSGTAAIPKFEIRSSRHSLGLSAEYQAVVNGTNGDVAVASAHARFLHSTLSARGSVSGRGSKTVSIDVDDRAGQVQDLLRVFVSSDRPPLEGAITFHAHVVIPPIQEAFLRKVQLNGEFGITGARFAKNYTQRKVDELSARANGQKKLLKTASGVPPVSSEWKGNVSLHDAVARISNAMFAVPGAVSLGGGTYDLASEAIDLRGQLFMHASLSKATGGIKSLLLMPLDPFFKKNGAGAVLPVHVTGTYAHPIFKVSLRRPK